MQRCEASELERLLSKGSLVDKDFGVTKVSKNSHIKGAQRRVFFLEGRAADRVEQRRVEGSVVKSIE